MGEGHQPLSLGQKPIILQDFCQKLHENERNWTKTMDPSMGWLFVKFVYYISQELFPRSYLLVMNVKQCSTKQTKIIKVTSRGFSQLFFAQSHHSQV